MKSMHVIKRVMLACAAVAVLAATGCDAPRDTGETQSSADSLVARRTAVRVGGWRGGAAVRTGYAVRSPVYGGYGPGIW